ncbi:MAG: hypothetical protein A2729_05340 [Candidatus Buchananbacteria bacterium RIFCSPHIGHO2_01_FULL_39_14]|uniref:DUF1761 domain-containing protein n=1 Tax=Candidatus Buchananbacteria bacterium RIFCSPHIGHO2_01_FULL_39_14 TaxID=1797532 RepID=A0A1G1XT92_9BACT|nr:MAG: hypothetical protein A2729_05340 [Candidatus Buchananbacteria bacterium RIFCSPHIGHO2_01_FULL_39_14]
MAIGLNYGAIVVAALFHMVLGWAWYSVLFGKAWMKLMKIDAKKVEEAKKKSMAKPFGIMTIAALVMSYILAHFIRYTGSMSALEGLQAGFWLWLGFIATVMVNSVLWEEKPWKLYLLNVAYYLVSLLGMGVILASWQ